MKKIFAMMIVAAFATTAFAGTVVIDGNPFAAEQMATHSSDGKIGDYLYYAWDEGNFFISTAGTTSATLPKIFLIDVNTNELLTYPDGSDYTWTMEFTIPGSAVAGYAAFTDLKIQMGPDLSDTGISYAGDDEKDIQWDFEIAWEDTNTNTTVDGTDLVRVRTRRSNLCNENIPFPNPDYSFNQYDSPFGWTTAGPAIDVDPNSEIPTAWMISTDPTVATSPTPSLLGNVYIPVADLAGKTLKAIYEKDLTAGTMTMSLGIDADTYALIEWDLAAMDELSTGTPALGWGTDASGDDAAAGQVRGYFEDLTYTIVSDDATFVAGTNPNLSTMEVPYFN